VTRHGSRFFQYAACAGTIQRTPPRGSGESPA
jgi:hypothetical protein